MSATEEKSTRAEDEDQEQEQGQEHETKADAEKKDEEKKDEEKKDEEKPSKPGMWKKMAGALPLIIGVGFCVAFFVWVCMQMAGQTVGGPPLLVGIFGGSLLGILAAGAGIALGRVVKDD